MTRSGVDRYIALVHQVDTSNPALGIPGTIEFSPIGLPLVMGRGPMVPTGGDKAGSSGDKPSAILNGWTSVSGQRQASDQGIANAHQYCFPAGTLVLLEDGSTRSIEQIAVGDRVLAVPDSDPLAVPAACLVERLFH